MLETPKPFHEEKSKGSVNEGRRSFLKALGAGALVASGILPNEAKAKSGYEDYDLNKLESTTHAIREEISKRYGIEIDFSPVFPSEEESKIAAFPIKHIFEKYLICLAIKDSLQLYPPFLLKNTLTTVIRVVNNLSYMDSGSTVGLSDASDGVIHLEYDTLSCGNELNQKEDDVMIRFYLRAMKETLHHELEHMIEENDSISDVEYHKTRIVLYEGKREQLMQHAYKYEIEDFLEEKWISEKKAEELLAGTEGFPTEYARKSEKEDRASVAEQLLGSKSKELLHRIKTDQVLKQKVEFMEAFFFEKSYGLMDEKYWSLVHNEAEPEFVEKYIKTMAGYLSTLNKEKYFAFMQKKLKSYNRSVSVDTLKIWREKLLELALR